MVSRQLSPIIKSVVNCYVAYYIDYNKKLAKE